MTELLATSDILEKMANEHPRDKISIGEIKDALHERGFAIMFIVFSLPLLIPLPLPTGIGTALSVPLFFFAYQFTINKDSPWLPKWVLTKEFGIESFRKIISKSVPQLRKIERVLKERVLIVSDTRGFEVFVGIFILLLNIPIALPFPMSNVIPAAAIIVIGFGMIEKDGLIMLAGVAVGVFAWIVCFLIGWGIYVGAGWLEQFLPDSVIKEVEHIKHEIEGTPLDAESLGITPESDDTSEESAKEKPLSNSNETVADEPKADKSQPASEIKIEPANDNDSEHKNIKGSESDQDDPGIEKQ